jgi:hypothetical protein
MNTILKQIGWGGVIGLIGGGIGMLVGFLAVLGAGIGPTLFFLIFVAFFVWAFWHFMFGPMYQTNRLMQIGEAADATIVSVAENGSSMQIGGAIPKPGVNIVLEVHPQGKPVYTAKMSTFISMFELNQYRPGNKVNVKFDPKDPQKVTIVEATLPMQGYGAAMPATPSPELMNELQQLVATQQRLFQAGEEAKATITGSTDTNVKVNGENPLLALTLEVHTAGGETFTATTKAAVVPKSLSKFAVGKEVTVKFDPKDHNQVTIFHSN